MDKNPEISKAIKLLGGAVKAAEKLNIENYQTVQQWRKTGVVPPQYCPLLEKETGNQVSRKKLRPRDWKLIWPEFAIPPGQARRRSTDPKPGVEL